MKKISLLLSFIALAICYTACSGVSGKGNEKPAATSGPAASAGQGSSWSAEVDGKSYSGNTSNGVSKVSLHENSTYDGLSFELGLNGQKLGFSFVINSTGQTDLRNGKIVTVCNYHSPDGTLYIDDSATVMLTPNAGGRTVGSFFGKWKNAHYGKTPKDAPETIQITNGKFDLP